MQPLLHSPFLQGLGYAIINSLWQFALLWLLYFSANSLFKLSSHQKYVTGLVLQLAGFTWFLGTFIFYYNQFLLPAQNMLSSHQTHLRGLTGDTATSIQNKFLLLVLRSEQFFPYLSVAYLTLLFILTLRWIYAYNYTQHVRTNGLSEAEDNWKVFVKKLSIQLNIKRPVHIFLSALVQTPLTVGFFKPVILIPLATINYLSQQQMEAVILHELAHIKRFDYLFNLSLAFIEACLFFNPFMQLINYQIKKERENCCDDWVLKYDYSAPSYARALLQIASSQMRSPLFALKATENKHLLINRIKRIIEKKERTFFNYKHQLLALLVMTLVFSLFSFLSPATKTTVALADQSQYRIQPVVAKVSNPLFSPVFFVTDSSLNISEQKKKDLEIILIKCDAVTDSPKYIAAPTGNVKDKLYNEITDLASENIEPPATEMIAPEINAIAPESKITTTANLLQNREEKHIKVEEEGNRAAEEADRQTEIANDQSKLTYNLKSGSTVTIPNLEKVRLQLKDALVQMKHLQNGTERMKLQRLYEAVAEINNTVSATPPSTRDVSKLYELALLETQIKTAIDSTNLPVFYTTGLNDDVNFNFNFQMPAVAQGFSGKEKPHTFSYEYHSRPATKVTDARALKEFFKAKKGRDKRIVTDDEDSDEMNIKAPLPPTPPAAPRKVYIIRI